MAEIFVPDGAWTFDGETLRIVPGGDDIHDLRRTLGEVTVPLEAIASVAFEPSRKGGSLQLRLRAGADPLTDVVTGRLGGSADPYRLAVPKNRVGAAEYFAEEVRTHRMLEQVPNGPCETFLLPGPAVPVSASAGDGSVSFDGERIRLEWNGFANSLKKEAGPQEFPLSQVEGVEWAPQSGLGYGYLRFRLHDIAVAKAPEKNPYCLAWGVQRYGGASALVGAAVLYRLRTRAALESAAQPSQQTDEHEALRLRLAELESHDAVIRRLKELGELHRSGVLTDEEFNAAKQALLRRLT